MKLRLRPILEHLDACEEGLAWIDQHKYGAFKEAWDNFPESESWHYWVIQMLRLNDFQAAQDIDMEGWRIYVRTKVGCRHAARRRYYLTDAVRKAVEEMLVQYAHLNGCARWRFDEEDPIDANP